MVSYLLVRSRLFPGLPPGYLWHTSPLQAVFTQPTPVLSLVSDLQSWSLSSQPHPPRQVSRQVSQAGECSSALILCVGISPLWRLHPYCCALLHSYEASPPPSPHLHQWRVFLVCGNFSSFTAPSQWCRSWPYSFVCFFFFFCPTQVHGDFLAFWEVLGLLPAFRGSVGLVVPHVDVSLMYLWGGRWSPRLTPLPSWRSLRFFFLLLKTVYIQDHTVS